MKYIPEEELKAEIERRIQRWTIRGKHSPAGQGRDSCDSRVTELSDLLSCITSLQQDKEALELEMCAEYWWEERGWIMIPPNTTLEGIESLLKQVKKKLQPEQPECIYGRTLEEREKYCKFCSAFCKARIEQEQPEVDLEKEIDEYFTLWRQGASDEGCFNANSQLVSIYDCYRIAHHFYELRINARKED
jgi:hypothetical protein